MKFDTSFCFDRGKLTTIIDGGAGSSGKGVIGSFIAAHADNFQFCCNTYYPQAGHWVKLDNGKSFFYQTFNSCAYNHQKFEKMYIGHGACIEPAAFWRELEENGIPRNKIGISPITNILQGIDADYERGCSDLDGNHINYGGIAIKSGTTAHGCGAAKARKILRKHNVLLARDVPEFNEFLCDVPGEIMNRLDRGQSGLMEVAQGFQLSYGLPEFYPFCTSRNCTVAAALDDMMLPVSYAGKVILNYRTFPIRINSKKFVELETGRHLTWAEVTSGDYDFKVEDSYSGDGYGDQTELSWEQLTKESGSEKPIMEITSVTKLPRRVFDFSIQNLKDSIKYNRTGHEIYLSINFANYVDSSLTGCRDKGQLIRSKRFLNWMDKYIMGNIPNGVRVKFIGTGALTDDKIVL